MDLTKSDAGIIGLNSAGVWARPPVTCLHSGKLDLGELRKYADSLNAKKIDAVVVWHPADSPVHLDDSGRKAILETWVSALSPVKSVVAVISHAETTDSFADALGSAQKMAVMAQDAGAKAMIIQPPIAFRNDEQVWQKTFAYHQAILESVQIPGVLLQDYQNPDPLIYPNELADDLLTLPQVKSIWVNTFDSMAKIQNMAGILRLHPEKILISGSDRCAGHAIMTGANILISQAAAHSPDPYSELLKAYHTQDFARFMKINKIVDALGQTIIQESESLNSARILKCLAMWGTVAPHVTDGNHQPPVTVQELQKINAILTVLQKRFDQLL